MIREDNRLADVPMTPVRCRECGTTVHARKASWEQTSIQWNATARAECAERRACAGTGNGTEPTARFATCHALRDSIDRAAATGAIEVGGAEMDGASAG
ncbi:hypothetical protein [Saccharomonospora iraqiensis]|uniref:hypothetical protein n=1 Tax=Saccharomonospora iraqiensis TaxID=52698 RepID=UPI00040A4613|nr:hypothetical protein [Saccharomonospora iraqiensis]